MWACRRRMPSNLERATAGPSPREPWQGLWYGALPLTLGAVLLAAGGCSDGTMAPNPSATCGSGSPVSLQVLQAATFDCSNGGTVITLAGGGASYLVVPQFPT